MKINEITMPIDERIMPAIAIPLFSLCLDLEMIPKIRPRTEGSKPPQHVQIETIPSTREAIAKPVPLDYS